MLYIKNRKRLSAHSDHKIRHFQKGSMHSAQAVFFPPDEGRLSWEYGHIRESLLKFRMRLVKHGQAADILMTLQNAWMRPRRMKLFDETLKMFDFRLLDYSQLCRPMSYLYIYSASVGMYRQPRCWAVCSKARTRCHIWCPLHRWTLQVSTFGLQTIIRIRKLFVYIESVLARLYLIPRTDHFLVIRILGHTLSLNRVIHHQYANYQ